ncbi:dTDP-4-dehydrorhamnose 3,5-epimerase [Schleiferiaceae bacterium]|nr:dTDP-4-dehydrorhamnose 3,5-epimerase [Schleiferiaceae bacterium]
MEIVAKVLTDAIILKPRIYNDDRGYFYESFNDKVFKSLSGTTVNFIQDNQSYSSKGTLRGLHFQKGGAAQAKLVRVVKGSAYDVAVDLRPDSQTFKQWYGVELSAENHLQFFIPRGFAHAFVALEDQTIFQYKVDNYYSGINDGGVIWNDEELAITWPELHLELSEKDNNLPKLNQLNINTLW